MGRNVKVDLAEELNRDDEPTVETRDIVVPPPAFEPSPILDASAPAPDFATMVKMLAEALKTSQTAAIVESRQAPRSREDHEYERKNAYNPLGDRDFPRPALECPTFRAIINEEDPSRPPEAYIEMPPDMMTREEIEATNFLQPQTTTIEMNDGSRVPFIVYIRRENGQADGKPIRKLLALPKKCYGKDLRNMVPNVKFIRRQLEQANQ